MLPRWPLAIPSGLTIPKVWLPIQRSFRDLLLDSRSDEVDYVDRPPHHRDPGGFEGVDLFLRRPRGARDDGAGVTHPAALGRGLAGNEADHRLPDVLGHESRRLLLVGPADLPHHHDEIGARIVLEGPQHVDEIGADHRIAADAHAGALADTVPGQVIHDLVGEGPAPRHQAYPSRSADRSRDDAHLAHPGSDQSGTVGPQEPGALFPDEGHHPGHVEHRNSLGDAHDEADPGIGGFGDRAGGHGGRDVDHRGVGPGLRDRFGDGVKHRDGTLEPLAPLPRRDARHDPGAVLDHLAGVETSVPPGDALHHQPGIGVDEDAHAASFASCTACCTAASMSESARIPAPSRIRKASSSLVPVSRMTIGTCTVNCRVAVTMPLATSSVRVIPPKMLKRIAFTAGSAVMILSAFTTFSGLELPPISRKLAGSPP